MAENRPPDLEQMHNPNVHHEPSDVNARALTKFGITFVLAGIVTLCLVWFVFDYFVGREAAKGPPPSQGIDVDARRLPPEPRLQSAPARDLAQMRAAEDQILNSYGWLDRGQGTVRIPISRAMELVAREGLPARQQSGPLTTDSATVPTASGLGPIMTQAGGPLSPNRVFPPDQPLQIHGVGDFASGRQGGGQPTPPQFSLYGAVGGVTPAHPPDGQTGTPSGRTVWHGQRPGPTQSDAPQGIIPPPQPASQQ